MKMIAVSSKFWLISALSIIILTAALYFTLSKHHSPIPERALFVYLSIKLSERGTV